MMKSNLETMAKKLRNDCLDMAVKGGSHLGGAFSCVDILTAIYYGGSFKASGDDRDRFILSKGHASLALYAILKDLNIIESTDNLEGHPKLMPGIEAQTGALGHGLSIGLGMARAAKLDGKDYATIVLLGDGECQEGSVWEAADFAGRNHIPIIAIVDHNGWGARIKTDDRLPEKFRAFGWNTREIQGHDFAEIQIALSNPPKEKPLAIIAHTIKGKGVSFMENDPLWHAAVPKGELLEQAYKELQ